LEAAMQCNEMKFTKQKEERENKDEKLERSKERKGS